jgi:hypothetical protein
MPIEWYRDLVIIVVGIVASATLVIMATTDLLLYRRLRKILGSLEAVIKNIECISFELEDQIVRPITQVMSVFAGIRAGMNSVSRLFGKENKGGENG